MEETIALLLAKVKKEIAGYTGQDQYYILQELAAELRLESETVLMEEYGMLEKGNEND